MSNVVDELDKDCLSVGSFKSRALGTKVLGSGIYLGGDPSNRNGSGEVRLWGRKATKGCVSEVAAPGYGVTPLRHLRRVQRATKTVSSNSRKLGHLSGLHLSG